MHILPLLQFCSYESAETSNCVFEYLNARLIVQIPTLACNSRLDFPKSTQLIKRHL